MCEAIEHDYQFSKIDCNDLHNINSFTLLTIACCGINNKGNSAFGICGEANYKITNINSSYNQNNYSKKKSFGACFRTFNIKGFSMSYLSFAHSNGHDIINTNFYGDPSPSFSCTIELGNIYNCSSQYILKYRGYNYVKNCNFGLQNYSVKSFECGASNTKKHLLEITNCIFDIKPTDTTSPCSLFDCDQQNPLVTLSLNLIGVDQCPVPSSHFTESQLFTASSVFSFSKLFSPSKKFSSSKSFTPSISFSHSEKFTDSYSFSKSKEFTSSSQFTKSISFSPSSSFSLSPSSQFTKSAPFSPSFVNIISDTFSKSRIFSKSYLFSPSFDLGRSTNTFTPSFPFTPSFTFSPNATKYPDGVGDYKYAQVSGKSPLDVPASAAAIGTTAGVSVVFIVVAIVLMLLYLRSKQKHMKNKNFDFSDSFLNDSTDDSESSYSYSYYTYEYTYASDEEEEDYTYYTTDTDSSLASFDD
ncbi:hypothetical protein M9Y10_029532 [Tritrichomonas musculus]|uniref:Uncharacterized protein n=1 Tax=Tritrichomonas musculus TaxID=1915356 RepID=A0ABR2KPF2_9EUKA